MTVATTGGGARRSGAPGASWRRIRAVAKRQTYVLWRSPPRLFDLTVWPVVDVLLFGSLGVFVARGGGAGGRTAFGYLLAGIVLWHVVYQAQIGMATGFLEESWSRNLLNLMVTPLREVEFVAGVALFGLVKIALGVSMVALLAAVAFAFDVTTLGPGLVPVATVLLVVGWVISLFVIGVVLRYGSGAEALAWGILFAVMPLSGVFNPVDALPGPLQPLARALPTTHAFAVARGLVDGRGTDWATLGWAALSSLVAAVAGLVFVARMLQVFRRRGYITRYT